MLDFFTLLTVFLLVTFAFLLPALIEFKKPKDYGPKIIQGIQLFNLPFFNIEQSCKAEKDLLLQLSHLLIDLPNLEAFTS